MPYEEVVEMWRRTITTAYEPEFLYERFAYQMEHTYPNRIAVPNSPARLSRENILRGLRIMKNLLWHVGLWGSYRKTFWKLAGPALKKGQIEQVIHVGVVGHHLINFAQECARGDEAASFYAQRLRQKNTTATSPKSAIKLPVKLR